MNTETNTGGLNHRGGPEFRGAPPRNYVSRLKFRGNLPRKSVRGDGSAGPYLLPYSPVAHGYSPEFARAVDAARLNRTAYWGFVALVISPFLPENSSAAIVLRFGGLIRYCVVMARWLRILLGALRCAVLTRRELALENLALRQQLAVGKARQPRPPLTATDRIFWVMLSRSWNNWRGSLQVVRPETVVRWHRERFSRYWAWKSRSRRGRPRLAGSCVF